MQLRLYVANTAYRDKLRSDIIQFEIVPQFDTDQANGQSPPITAIPGISASSSRRPAWLTSASIRDNKQIELLHLHLVSKFGDLLLPTFPIISTSDASWGTREYLHRCRRRINRYFQKILSRTEIQTDHAVYDFMSGTLDRSIQTTLKNGLFSWKSWWKFGSTTDHLKTAIENLDKPYEPIHLVDKVVEASRINKNIQTRLELREDALSNILECLDKVLFGLQKMSTAFTKVAISFSELANAHCSRPTLHHLQASDPLSLTVSFANDSMVAERKFRDYGTKLVEISRGIDKEHLLIVKHTVYTLGETLLEQRNDLSQVRIHLNRQNDLIKSLDKAIDERTRLESDRDNLINITGSTIGNWARRARISRLTNRLDTARESEMQLQSKLGQQVETFEKEIDWFWSSASQEMAEACSVCAQLDLKHYKLVLKRVREWELSKAEDSETKTELTIASIDANHLVHDVIDDS